MITWMQEWKQELDYSKAKIYGVQGGNVRLDNLSPVIGKAFQQP
jgi:hypothetical protein